MYFISTGPWFVLKWSSMTPRELGLAEQLNLVHLNENGILFIERSGLRLALRYV